MGAEGRSMPRARARSFDQDLMKGEHKLGTSSKQTPSLKGGLTLGTTIHPYDGQEGGDASGAGTSIFDPVLTELCYRWFSPPAGLILDPFAGGSVRGIVASKLGREYVGVELRAEQIAANRKQAKAICEKPMPKYIEGDALDTVELCPGVSADFVFSCPPYGDLEVYSDDPRDISTMPYEKFRATLVKIVMGACHLLKPDRFACFIVGDIRDKKGLFRNFPGHTIEAFEAAGLALYNDAILVTAVGSLPIRVRRQFEAARKLGTTHQRMLVFVKGDPRKATEAIGKVEFGDLEEPKQPLRPAAEFGDIFA